MAFTTVYTASYSPIVQWVESTVCRLLPMLTTALSVCSKLEVIHGAYFNFVQFELSYNLQCQ